MAELYKLCNQVKHYEWGSPDLIPHLLGLAGNGEPWAELWMGSHPALPSRVMLPSGEVGLGEFIAENSLHHLGDKINAQYGELPFLFKLLAAEKPLSIQVHPGLAPAHEGFNRENHAGLAADAPNRNYKDANHKPEIICAITPFTGMCGFREPDEVYSLISQYLAPCRVESATPDTNGYAPFVNNLVSSVSPFLTETSSEGKLKVFLEALFELSPEDRNALTEFILSTDNDASREWRLMQDFARLYPGDPAVIAPLYMNVFELQPGEAIFLDAGILHSYIHGFGVELMANSDNVLRGGLTPKYVDIPELIKVVNFTPMKPEIIQPEDGFSCFTYPVSCEEFMLAVMHGTEKHCRIAAPSGPAICMVIEGEALVNDMVLKKGESAFIPPIAEREPPIIMQGDYLIYIASTPQ